MLTCRIRSEQIRQGPQGAYLQRWGRRGAVRAQHDAAASANLGATNLGEPGTVETPPARTETMAPTVDASVVARTTAPTMAKTREAASGRA